MPIIDIAPTPTAWLTDHLPQRFHEYGSDPTTGPWYSCDEILADQADLLRRWHHRLVTHEQTTPAAAATYLAGWIGGTLAGAIGHALATVDAGFVVDQGVRWHQHPDGWIDRVDLGDPDVLVPDSHPWTDHPRTTIIDIDQVLARTVDHLVTFLEPVIDACHALAPTGRAGLWNEVADGLGLAVAHTSGLPVRQDIVELLGRSVRHPGRPWRATPTLRITDSSLGPVYIGQKGGCCLAYTCPDHGDVDDDHRAYLERFPEQPDEPRYCTTCKFRDPLDSEQRQLFWIERRTG